MTVTLLGQTKFEWGQGNIIIIRVDGDYFAQRDVSSDLEDADGITASLAMDLLARDRAKPTAAGKAWLAEQAKLKTLYKSLTAPEIPPEVAI